MITYYDQTFAYITNDIMLMNIPYMKYINDISISTL